MRSAKDYMGPSEASFDSPFLPMPLKRHRTLQRLAAARAIQSLSLERHNMNHKMTMYYNDMFHTLVNMPNYLFFLTFLLSYLSMYTTFAFLYMLEPDGCITKVHQFSHAMWFSVHTSATIGYGHMAPNPDCVSTNLLILAEVLTTCLLQAALLGVVYARFSTPSKRASTLRFSEIMACHDQDDGTQWLCFRVANLRQHQLLHPEVRMLFMRLVHHGPDSHEYVYSDLNVRQLGGGKLWMGVPSILYHTVDADSPLYGLNEEDLDEMDVEILVILDGIDETTATPIQARRSYFPSDIRWGHQFRPVLRRGHSGRLGVDYADFDATQTAAPPAPSTAESDGGV
uniref:ATP-sensitive inward rectifier potassium channel 12 n=1 Tax=Auxenochlorella protothecoides TaxID=3075 RepID=A0A1D2AEI2_AUXPR